MISGHTETPPGGDATPNTQGQGIKTPGPVSCPSGIQELLVKARDLAPLYAEAEAAAKEVELLDSQAVIPCINELRYAGNHLSRYLLGGTKDEKPDAALDSYGRHCRRAAFDAYEAGILLCLTDLKQFDTDYRNVVVVKIWPEYSEACRTANSVRAYLCGVVKDSRENYASQCRDHFRKLVEIRDKLPVIRQELNKQIKKDQRNGIIALATLVVAGISMVYAIFGPCSRPTASAATQTAIPQATLNQNATPVPSQSALPGANIPTQGQK